MLLCMVCSMLVQPAFAAYGYESDEDLKNECGITFNSNGGSGYMEPLWRNGSFKLPECEFTAPEGYRFKGWRWNGELKQPGDAVYLGGVVEAVALWEELPEETIPAQTEETVPATEESTEPPETAAPTEPQATEPEASENTEATTPEKTEKKEPAEKNDKVWTYVALALGVVIVGMGVAIVLLLKKKK